MIGVISAGGKGTRLSSITNDIPKPMVKVLGKPILQYQIECLRDNGIKIIYLLIGHLGDKIKSYFGDGNKFGVEIHYVYENEPLGSSGSLFYLRETIIEDFIFLYGDLMLDVCFDKMIKFHKEHNAIITLLSHPNSHPFDSDLIITNDHDLVVGIDSKNNVRQYFYQNLVNAGIYIISNKIFKTYFTSPVKTDFEKDVIVNEIKNDSVYSYRTSEYVKDAGTPERYHSVCADVSIGIVKSRNLSNPQKCIFLDRDGTINRYKGFIKEIDDLELEDGVIEGFRTINNSEYLAIIITNQPVVARGDVTIDELNLFHKKIQSMLGNNGVYFDDLFYCPHHPDKGFDGEIKELKIDCNCRKPKIGLLIKAREKYNIDLSKSYFVGDSTVDIQTGINAGMKTVLVKTGVKGEDDKFDVKADFVIPNLSYLEDVIKKGEQR